MTGEHAPRDRVLLSLGVAMLFTSGACALVYQTLWMRALRAVFGASTLANAAVLAIFMGGLGVGALVIGRRAERSARPLLLYGVLELGVAAGAALSPFTIALAASIYRATGGSAALGSEGATVVRLLLASLALGAPAVLLGGTLPALAKAVVGANDASRRSLAALYGANTVGAVVGCVLATFALLELFGTRGALLGAAAVNALVGAVAVALSWRWPAFFGARTNDGSAPAASASPPSAVGGRVPLLALAFLVGAAFFLLELVWYRMLAPILGGTTFTFGVILAVALAGIGLGGALFAALPPRAPTAALVAVSCALEGALALAPYAAGDGVARLAFFLRELGEANGGTMVAGWNVVAALVVFPPAFVAGWQLPLMLALKGKGGERVARDTGDLLFFNTLGAIAGALAGGFVLLPLLSAPGLWVAAALALAAAALPFALFGKPGTGALRAAAAAAMVAAAAFATAPGPSALWRHTTIGAGRADLHASSPRALTALEHKASRHIAWERDGVEASVAVRVDDQRSLFVNGKSDGGTLSDAPNMTGAALVPALLHDGGVKTAMIVGLGSGETAGFLARVATITRIDVFELEPAVIDYARECAVVNLAALDSPRVHVEIGDARELVATSSAKVDLIVSEPSNPYRDGVAALFTRELYEDARAHLADGGMFAQWLQLYEIDASALRIVLATMGSVFPHVSVWRLQGNDALLLAGNEPLVVDVDTVERRLAEEPWATWSLRIARISGAEGLLALYVAGDDEIVRFVGADEEAEPTAASERARREALVVGVVEGLVNTDDRPRLEFSVARSVGRALGDPLAALTAAQATHKSRDPALPALAAAEGSRVVVGAHVLAQRGRPWFASFRATPGSASVESTWAAGDLQSASARASAASEPRFVDPTVALVRAHLASLSPPPAAPVEGGGGGRASLYRSLDELAAAGLRTEAAVIRAEAQITDKSPDMVDALEDAISLLRINPWVHATLTRTLLLRTADAALEPAAAARALEVLVAGPLAANQAEVHRLAAMHALAARATAAAADAGGGAGIVGAPPPSCVRVYQAAEPHPFWTAEWLASRARCYAAHDPARAAAAAADLARHDQQQQ